MLPDQACDEAAMHGGRQAAAAGTLGSQDVLADTVGHGAAEAGVRVDSVVQEGCQGLDLVVVGGPNQRVLANQRVHAAHVVVQHGEDPVRQTAAALGESCDGAEPAGLQKVARDFVTEFNREVLDQSGDRSHPRSCRALSPCWL